MKLELIKETKGGRSDWYEVRVNDELHYGTYVYEDALAALNAVIKNPDFLKIKREILQSHEIDVSSNENKN